ncbi:MAG: Zn-ribbon domain-containing OB-fold protein [Candidatus Bathyarchaeia archaeon]
MSAPNYLREAPRRYRLEGARCKGCGAIHFPPKAICDRCGGRDLESEGLSGEGELVAYTIIRHPPKGFEDQAPYVIGIVQLKEGVRILSQIVDCDPTELREGMRLKVAIRRIKNDGGFIEYGYKFRPA